MDENTLPALPTPDVSFRLFGPVEVIADGRRVDDLGERKERALLAALLLARSKRQRQDQLMGWLWDEPFPESAHEEFYRAVSRTRKRLGNLGFDLRRDGKSYELQVSDERVDVHVFSALVKQAQDLLNNDDRQAVAVFRKAFDLTSEVLLADLDGHRVDGLRQQWAATRRQAMLQMTQASLRLGRHHELIAGLIVEHLDNPYDQAVLELLMIASYRAGQQVQAQQLYLDLKARLADIYTIDTRRLDDLYTRMMNQDPSLDSPAEETPTTEADPGPEKRPENEASAAAGTHFEFHGKVVAPRAVFGVSNTFRSR
ncbi:AfsR/SARP family transcriptional regulator [Herbidospora galbida]|nr:BTAD domain-containing putative transcriptional regulator [Herbidospora galbida]